jgi:hypothetical protein
MILVNSMSDTVAFICDAKEIELLVEAVAEKESSQVEKGFKSQLSILACMAKQVTECAYFIKDYAMDTSFCMYFFAQNLNLFAYFLNREAYFTEFSVWY